MQSYMAGMERRAKATIWRYVMAVLSGVRGGCIVYVCGPPLLVGFMCRGCGRARSGASYFPYVCMDKVLVVVYDA